MTWHVDSVIRLLSNKGLIGALSRVYNPRPHHPAPLLGLDPPTPPDCTLQAKNYTSTRKEIL